MIGCGGLLSVFLHSTNKGFWACLGYLPPGKQVNPLEDYGQTCIYFLAAPSTG